MPTHKESGTKPVHKVLDIIAGYDGIKRDHGIGVVSELQIDRSIQNGKGAARIGYWPERCGPTLNPVQLRFLGL